MIKPVYVMYLAVLPRYRSRCVELLQEELGDKLEIFVSTAHLDASVRTGIPSHSYSTIRMVRLFGGRLFLQLGHWRTALSAETAVLDLNPRSLSSVFLLLCRRILGRRTLLWGHLYPQSGQGSATAWLRSTMRRLSSGTILYTYSNLKRARLDLPSSRVWVAPNSLYALTDIEPADGYAPRNSILYVGRFEPAKKIALLIRGFAVYAVVNPAARLILIGDGGETKHLKDLVSELGLVDRVDFAGWIDDVNSLRDQYRLAFCSVSPGFAGLGLTQSLGFGIPMAVALTEPHSPEIELDASGGVEWFASNDPEALASALENLWAGRSQLPSKHISAYVAERYSAEAMAGGLLSALKGDNQHQAMEREK